MLALVATVLHLIPGTILVTSTVLSHIQIDKQKAVMASATLAKEGPNYALCIQVMNPFDLLEDCSSD